MGRDKGDIQIMNTQDLNHIEWCYWRLINFYHEDPYVDYLTKLREIILEERRRILCEVK